MKHLPIPFTDILINIMFVPLSSVYQTGRSYNYDGKKVSSMEIENGDESLVFLCDALASGNHSVEIKCTGEANIDSIIVFP